MKKLSRSFAFIIALVMLFSLFSACAGGGEAETTPAPAQSETPAATPEASAAPAEDQPPAESQPPEAVPEASEEVVMGPDFYYLREEPTEISMTFSVMFWFASMFPDGWGNSPWWDEVEKALNVKFTFNEFMNNTYKEKVNLMIAGDETTDIITDLASTYTGGLQGAIDDEVIYDVAPYLEANAPLYYDALYSDAATLKSITNNDGTQGALYSILQEPQGLTGGLWIRADWLESVGMEVPATPDEMYGVLEAFKNKYDCTAAFFQNIGVNSVGIACEGVWNAFGPLGNYVDGGEVKYGLVQDYARDYLVYLRSLAQNGLLMTTDYTDLKTADLMAQNQMGIFGDNISTVPDNLALMDDPNAALKAMAPLGEPTEYDAVQTLIPQQSAALSIFTGCENPELIVKMTDYFFTEQGSLLANYGIEGLSFNYDSSGEPVYTDLIVNNPDDIPVDAALGYWTDRNFLPAHLDPFRTYYNYFDYQLEAPGIWASAYTGSSMSLPAVTLTTEENDSIKSNVADMNTFINERVNQFVFGDLEPTEANFDEFVDAMYGQNQLQKTLDAYNAAYERYLAR